jgi:hypothetical protein
MVLIGGINRSDQGKYKPQAKTSKNDWHKQSERAGHCGRSIKNRSPIYVITYQKRQHQKQQTDAPDGKIGSADIALCGLKIVVGLGFREFIAQTVAQTYVKKREPRNEGTDGEPNSIIVIIQKPNG